MIQNNWKTSLLLMLGFILAVSLSYLVLQEKDSNQQDEEQFKMSVALVNEDDGGYFNEEKIVFGDEVVKSVINKEDHEWYVVSRGVAESGYERNVYDMMIVIPNNFTEKSLSINEQKPEQVTLSYKINTTGHEDVRAEAEKVAGNILNEFNRKLIDVYFASIIGSLQNAQDNISDMIKKENNLTHLYNSHVQSPLADYANQFDTVQQFTNHSIDNYSFLQDKINLFESNLDGNLVKSNEYSMNLANVIDENIQLNKNMLDYTQLFSKYVNEQKNTEWIEMLSQLERENDYIYRQFIKGKEENHDETIKFHMDGLQGYFDLLVEKIEKYQADFDKRIDKDFDRIISDAIQVSLDTNEEIVINDIFETTIEEVIFEQLENYIEKLPTINVEEIKQMDLPASVVEDLVYVSLISEKYIKENNLEYINDENKLLIKKINKVKDDLKQNGVIVTNEKEIQPFKDYEHQHFYLTVPSSFYATNIKLTLNGITRNIEKNDFIYENDKIKIKLTDLFAIDSSGQKLTVEANFKLDEQADLDEINIFNPVAWEWHTVQESMEEINGDEDDPPVVTEKLYKSYNTNSYVHSRLINNPNAILIEAIPNMLKEYYQLYSLYEAMYGITRSNFDENEFVNNDETLIEMATSYSLYEFLNKKDVRVEIQEYMNQTIKESIRKELISELNLNELKTGIEKYESLLTESKNKAKNLAVEITKTASEAKKLNLNIHDLLVTLNEWRETNDSLLTEQINITEHNDLTVMNVVNLETDFQPLIMETEMLINQAQLNVDDSDTVYQTLDNIHEEAEKIKLSGTNLVEQATVLSNELTNKANEDSEFSENFSQVMKNSRIGERQNEDLYKFLSRPVKTENSGIIKEGKSFIPYFLVVILTTIALLTAYGISNVRLYKRQSDAFESEATLIRKNTPLMLIAIMIGLFEGLIIGLASSYLLAIESPMLWIIQITLLQIAILMIITYLLRQLKTIGMFITLSILSFYLFITSTLGFNFTHNEFIKILRKTSPLQRVETFIKQLYEGAITMSTYLFPTAIIVVSILIGVVINLIVIERTPKTQRNDSDEK